MRYADFKYIYPPRPETAVPPSALDELEQRGWWGQPKLNGTNCLLFVAPAQAGKRATLQRGRHGDTPIKSWSPGANWNRFAERLPAGWCVLHGELLHTKGTGRDTVYLHDMLVLNGEYLVGTTYRARYEQLQRLCSGAVPRADHLDVLAGIWLAPIYLAGLRGEWERLRGTPGVEGLVAKDPAAKLALCCRPSSNSAWQVKSRFPAANVSF